VSQVVNAEAVAETGSRTSWDESGASPVGQPHDRATRHGEHEVVRPFAIDGGGQVHGDEPGNGNGPGEMRLRCAEDDTPAHVGESAADVDATAVEVDVTNT
jgi:hypothetical protein